MINEQSQRPVVFLTGSTDIWGAELSLLTMGRGLGQIRNTSLACSNPLLKERWKREVNESAVSYRARSGRLSRAVDFALVLRQIAAPHAVLVVFDYYLIPLMVVSRFWLRRRKVSVVVDLHDSARRNPLRKPYFWLLRMVDGVIAVSDFTAQEVPGITTTRVVARPVVAPADAESHLRSRHEGSRSGGTLVVGVVGQVTPAKRALDAVELLKTNDSWILEVRGSAPDGHDRYLAQVLDVGSAFPDRFRYRGSVSNDSVMSGLDVLLHLNEQEPFGRVVVEAQLAGVIAIVPSRGGSSELVVDGQTGFHFNPDDLPSIHLILGKLADQPKMSDSVRSRAAAYAKASYAVDFVSEQYNSALNAIVGASRG